MSLLSGDRVEVLFGPTRVSLARGRSGDRVFVDCAAGEEMSWRTALEALGKALAQLNWRNSDVAVTLSNHLVRYALLPRAGELTRADERVAAARHQLRSVYGDRADRWTVVLDDRTGDGPALAAGVDTELMTGITAALREAQLRPVAVEPLFAAAFNACRRSIGRVGWLAVGEPGRVCLAQIERGRWSSVRSERIRESIEIELPRLLERARFATGGESKGGRVIYVASEAPRAQIAREDGWAVEWFRFPQAEGKSLALGSTR